MPPITIGIQNNGGGIVTMSVGVEGVDVVKRRFQGLEERAKDPSPSFLEVQGAFFLAVDSAFKSEGASTELGKWPYLTETTAADRAIKGFPREHPILERTGALRRSLTLPGGDAIYLATQTSLQLGTDVSYFKYHQSHLPRKKLPRRAPVSLTDADKNAIVRPIRNYITDKKASSKLKGRGRGGATLG